MSAGRVYRNDKKIIIQLRCLAFDNNIEFALKSLWYRVYFSIILFVVLGKQYIPLLRFPYV